MVGFERSDDYQPLFWVRGRPVHVTSLLVAVHILSLVTWCLLRGFGLFNPVPWLGFRVEDVLHGQVWRVATYIFAHDPSIPFLIDMAMLFFFGREVERYFGRRVFASLYAGLTLTAPLVLLGLHFLHLNDLDQMGVDGGYLVHFGVFIAFVTIYPSVQIFFSIPAVWIAGVLLAMSTLIFFTYHLWNSLLVMWSTVGAAFLGTRYATVGNEAFAFFGGLRELLPRRSAPHELKPRAKPRRAVDTPAHAGRVASVGSTVITGGGRGEDVHESIDPLLEKISKHGLASLTNSERATLERARVSLLRKERGG